MTLDLFGDADHGVLDTVGVHIYRSKFAKHGLFVLLAKEIPFVQYQWRMYGQHGDRPRLECWYHDDPQRGYKFGGGKEVIPTQWGLMMAALKSQMEVATGQMYDSCFANFYRGGQDKIDWHADDEDWIGPWIGSLSFGGSAVMRFRRKQRIKGERSLAITLHDGDLLVMPPGTQEKWEHSIPRTTQHRGQRINLTFRQTVK